MQPIRLLSVTPVSHYRLVILCDDETLRLWSFPFPGRSQKTHPLRDSTLFRQVEITPDGLWVTWPNGEYRCASELCRTGKLLPLSMRDLSALCARNILSTSEVAELLGCTRQNVDSLAARGKLHPVKSYRRNRLFLRGDAIRRRWWSNDALPSTGAGAKEQSASTPCPEQYPEHT
ncbi:MAG: helix-turn-helix domain-containing protein [Clostridiales bacterium]|nr:helix-turn-helix domain-containing protein [Clostridiales bacterium]